MASFLPTTVCFFVADQADGTWTYTVRDLVAGPASTRWIVYEGRFDPAPAAEGTACEGSASGTFGADPVWLQVIPLDFDETFGACDEGRFATAGQVLARFS